MGNANSLAVYSNGACYSSLFELRLLERAKRTRPRLCVAVMNSDTAAWGKHKVLVTSQSQQTVYSDVSPQLKRFICRVTKSVSARLIFPELICFICFKTI